MPDRVTVHPWGEPYPGVPCELCFTSTGDTRCIRCGHSLHISAISTEVTCTCGRWATLGPCAVNTTALTRRDRPDGRCTLLGCLCGDIPTLASAPG